MLQNIKILFQYIKTKYNRNFASCNALASWQEDQVQAFLRKILPASPFYQQYYGKLMIEQWRDWPMINKKIMMDHFTSLNTVGITKEEAFAVALAAEESRNFSPTVRQVTVGLSSGTSGNRGLFIASKEEQAKWAGAILAKALPQSLWHGQRIAFFLRANSNLYKTIGSYHIQFKFFDLLHPLEQLINDLHQFQPTILVGPPSMLRILASALETELKISPKKIISVAEVLEPQDRQYLKEKFQQTIHQIYQCTEGFLGITCPCGTLHLNEDLLVIQKDYLDDEHKRFSPIVTDFMRTSQPIIRYRLDDILIEKKEGCPCGSPLMAIERIEGRCDDIFYLPSNTKSCLKPIFPDFIRRAIITADESISEYLAIQKTERCIDIAIRCSNRERAEACVKTKLNELWLQAQVVAPSINFIVFPERNLGQKLRRVERQFKVAWKK